MGLFENTDEVRWINFLKPLMEKFLHYVSWSFQLRIISDFKKLSSVNFCNTGDSGGRTVVKFQLQCVNLSLGWAFVFIYLLIFPTMFLNRKIRFSFGSNPMKTFFFFLIQMCAKFHTVLTKELFYSCQRIHFLRPQNSKRWPKASKYSKSRDYRMERVCCHWCIL